MSCVDWGRIEPQEGEWDVAALRRYQGMLDGLVHRGICPIICLHHFTHPRWFEQKGAFLNPDAPELFERFTRRVVDALEEHCHRWLTFNEPHVYAAMGYAHQQGVVRLKGTGYDSTGKWELGMADAIDRVYRRGHE